MAVTFQHVTFFLTGGGTLELASSMEVSPRVPHRAALSQGCHRDRTDRTAGEKILHPRHDVLFGNRSNYVDRWGFETERVYGVHQTVGLPPLPSDKPIYDQQCKPEQKQELAVCMQVLAFPSPSMMTVVLTGISIPAPLVPNANTLHLKAGLQTMGI